MKRYIKSTSDRELNHKKSELFKRVTHRLGGDELENSTNRYWENPARNHKNWTDEERYEQSILDCIEMIHSIMAYDPYPTVESILSDKYLQDDIDKLGYDTVESLVSQEMAHFESIGRKRRTSYTSDGTYAGIEWGDW